MPKNSDFEYEGLKTEHASNWDANNYHQRQGVYNEPRDPSKERVKPQPMGQLNNVVRRSGKHTEPPKGKQTNLYDHQLEQAKAKDWRNRNLTNNQIIDY